MASITREPLRRAVTVVVKILRKQLKEKLCTAQLWRRKQDQGVEFEPGLENCFSVFGKYEFECRGGKRTERSPLYIPIIIADMMSAKSLPLRGGGSFFF